MATAYTCVVWKLWANVLPGEHNEQNISHQHNAKKKVIKMVCIMLVAFVVCWVPLQVRFKTSVPFQDLVMFRFNSLDCCTVFSVLPFFVGRSSPSVVQSSILFGYFHCLFQLCSQPHHLWRIQSDLSRGSLQHLPVCLQKKVKLSSV
jgi:FtsH-binding integral membrane protein